MGVRQLQANEGLGLQLLPEVAKGNEESFTGSLNILILDLEFSEMCGNNVLIFQVTKNVGLFYNRPRRFQMPHTILQPSILPASACSHFLSTP